MELRRAVPEDAEGIAAVNTAAWKVAFRGVISDQFLEDFDGVPGVRRHDSSNEPVDGLQIVVVEDGRIVGWSTGRPADDDDCDPMSTYEIGACYVAPDYWRRGIASRMINHLLSTLDSRWRQVILWTARDAPGSRAFYEALGFYSDGKEMTVDRKGAVQYIRLRRDPLASTPTHDRATSNF